MRSAPTATVLLAVTCFVARPLASAELQRESFDDSGFETIFDGRSLDGWHISAASKHSKASDYKSGGRWVVEGGALVGSHDTPGNGGIAITDKHYGDFEVVLEMNNDYGPDSGLFLRSTEKGEAWQYMVDYHANGNVGGVHGEDIPGPRIFHANYKFKKKVTDIEPHPSAFPLRVSPQQWPEFWKHGQWNELRARIVGNPPKITTWINGVRFMEFEDSEKRHPARGGIALQVHGGGNHTDEYVRYRNIRVKQLD